MTLSIEVLPAPFGPMMARTSPFLMSNDTSRIARTPPNDSDTFSTDSSTSPAAMSLGAGALMARYPKQGGADSPPPASAASGGEGSGVGGISRQQGKPPTPTACGGRPSP